MTVEQLIPTGSKNAISRSYLLTLCKEHGIADSDRKMRRLISQERANSVIISVQDGSGYFRPTKEDLPELKHYVAQEHKRSMAILHNLKMANKLLEDYEHERV